MESAAKSPASNCGSQQLHIYAALAEKERALISERTKAALKAAKADGAPGKSRRLKLRQETRRRIT
jgi:DNA invertase Pin-like site-specific DNA recombinase